MKFLGKFVLLAALGAGFISNAQAAYQTYTNDASFAATVKDATTDTFDGAFAIKNNADAKALSAAHIGYVSTGFDNLNIYSSGHFCWGCNGSGYVDLASTTMGTVGGVYGFKTEIFNNSGNNAFVTFANGSTLDVLLAGGNSYFAITSTDLIAKVEFSAARGQAGHNVIAFDNVTVANAVPEPASVAMLGLGLAGIAALRRRRS